MRHTILPLILLAAFPAIPTLAATFDVGPNSYNVQDITTDGTITDRATANHALLVLDFDPAHVYLFGYEWQSGTQTGYSMFTTIAANSAATITYDLPFGPGFIAGIDYAGNLTTDNYDPANYSSWAYYISDLDAPFSYPAFGASDRTLLNGSIDDWTLMMVSPVPPDYNPTRSPSPLAAVPEPASLGLLSLGLLLLARRRR